MSRSGYSEVDDDTWALIRWRGAVNSAIRGKRGQAFLKEMLEALDAMPEKKLHPDILVADGCMCAMGAVVSKRKIEINESLDFDACDTAEILGIPSALAQEIAFENDEARCGEIPEERWLRMRAWVCSQINQSGEKTQ